MSADENAASDWPAGAQSHGVGADGARASDHALGPDPIIYVLGSLSATFEDIQRTRKSANLRAIAAEKNGQPQAANAARVLAETLEPVEDKARRALKSAVSKHPLYPWLTQFKGLSGPTTARLMAIIADPHRFPGLRCEQGHYLPDTYGGETCPVFGVEDDVSSGPCLAPVHPRRGSGVRSLWHYLGLHAVDGKSPRLRKGHQGDWNTRGRTLVLGPDGIADQIVKHRTAVYREVYDQTRERLQRERGADEPIEGEQGCGSPLTDPGGAEVVADRGAETQLGLRPFQIHAIAKKVAAKRFVGDLLIEWKRLG